MPTQDPGDKKLLDRIDAAVDRIRKQVRIDLPYFLTAASKDTALRPSPYNWQKHSFFETDEEHLQHQTWRYREDPEDLGCLILHGGIEESRRREEKAQKGKAKDPIRQRKVAQTIARRGSFSGTDEESGPSQSANGSPRKKKTSWKDYQKRKLNGGLPSKSPEPVTRSEESRSRKPDNSVVKEPGKDLLVANGVESRDHGRSSKEQHPETSRSGGNSSRPLKANVLKEGSRPVQRDARPIARPQPSKRSPSFDLPDLHSPIHLDEPTDGLPHGFPALLSPLHGLPKQFQEDLEAHKAARKRDADDHAGLDTPENKRIKVERSRADSSLSSASSQSRSAPDEHRSQSNQTIKELKSELTKSQTELEPPIDESDKVTSLIVRLRYGKNKRKDVDRILRARADSKLQNADDRPTEKIERDKAADRSTKDEDKVPNGVPNRERANTNGRTSSNGSKDSAAISRKQPSKAPPAASSSASVKRARDEDTLEQTSSNKRQHTENTTRKEPETPKKKGGHLSPLPSSKSAAAGKSLPKNPTSAVKDLKSTAMQRNRSQDSVESTPRTTQATPIPPPRSQPSTTAASQQNGTTPDTKPLTKLNEDLAFTGRKLKKAFDKARAQTLDSEKAGQAVNPSDWKCGALAGLESLVAYVLMFSATHAVCRLSNRPASATIFGQWQSMMPLYGFVEQLSRRDDRLRGLHAQIGLGIAHHIIRSWSELKPEQRGSDQKVASSNYTAQDVLNNALAEMPGWSEDAYKFLNDKVLEKDFPITWKAVCAREEMAKDDRWENEMLAYAVATAKDKDVKSTGSNKKAAPGRFRFPLLSDASSLEVCRFVVGVLKEYAEKEKLNYMMQVRI